MRTTFRLFAAACLFTVTLGCQPETAPDTSTDVNVDLGEPDAGTPIEGSNTTATGEVPQSNTTGAAEVPAVTEVPAEN